MEDQTSLGIQFTHREIFGVLLFRYRGMAHAAMQWVLALVLVLRVGSTLGSSCELIKL